MGKKVGVELFVMDDGWFGERKDDKRALGDWTPNNKKLPDIPDRDHSEGRNQRLLDFANPEVVDT